MNELWYHRDWILCKPAQWSGRIHNNELWYRLSYWQSSDFASATFVVLGFFRYEHVKILTSFYSLKRVVTTLDRNHFNGNVTVIAYCQCSFSVDVACAACIVVKCSLCILSLVMTFKSTFLRLKVVKLLTHQMSGSIL